MLVEMRLCYIARMTAEATLNIMQLQTYNYMQLANHGGTYIRSAQMVVRSRSTAGIYANEPCGEKQEIDNPPKDR